MQLEERSFPDDREDVSWVRFADRVRPLADQFNERQVRTEFRGRRIAPVRLRRGGEMSVNQQLNALGHAWASAVTAYMFGEGLAERATWVNENILEFGPNRRDARAGNAHPVRSDLWNDRVGRRIGAWARENNLPIDALDYLVRYAHDEGALTAVVSDGGRAVGWNRIPSASGAFDDIHADMLNAAIADEAYARFNEEGVEPIARRLERVVTRRRAAPRGAMDDLEGAINPGRFGDGPPMRQRALARGAREAPLGGVSASAVWTERNEPWRLAKERQPAAAPLAPWRSVDSPPASAGLATPARPEGRVWTANQFPVALAESPRFTATGRRKAPDVGAPWEVRKGGIPTAGVIGAPFARADRSVSTASPASVLAEKLREIDDARHALARLAPPFSSHAATIARGP